MYSAARILLSERLHTDMQFAAATAMLSGAEP